MGNSADETINKDINHSKKVSQNAEHIDPFNIILPAAVIATILLVLFTYTFVQRNTIVRNAEQVTNQMAEYIAGHIANEINFAKSSIKLSALTISESMTSDTLDNPTEIIMPMVANTPFGGIEYIRADGMNVMNIGAPFDASDRVYYIEGIKGNTGIWNNYHPKIAQETLMNFYTPLQYNGENVGVITGYIAATSQIAEFFETKLYGQTIYGMLIDENNMVICSTLKTEYIPDQTLDMFMERFNTTNDERAKLYTTLSQASEKATSYKDPSGEGRICVVTIPDTEWKIAIIVPAASFNKILSDNTKAAVITVIVISLILILYATYVLIRNVRRRRAIAVENVRLTEEKNEYYSTLDTLGDIFYSLHVIDLVEDTAEEFKSKDDVREVVNHKDGAIEMMEQVMRAVTEEECQNMALEFTDLRTLADRMTNKKVLSTQLVGKNTGWFDASFISMEQDDTGKPTKVIFTTRVIDEEKKQEENLIKKSQTDEMTGLLNRRAYEEDIYEHNDKPDSDDYIYISLDVNGLKVINDTLGHMAGDELIIGSCQCMKQSLGAYGKLYRIGGDEFVAILYCDTPKAKEVLADFDNTIANWTGKLIDGLSISYGWISTHEEPSLSVRQLGAVAEQRMYDAKAAHYKKAGVDRRGQQDAHKALCALYTKILKINITDDSYQVVNMDTGEQTVDKGFSDKISEWLATFGTSGQVHPDDLDEYLKITDIKYMRDYFADNKTSLHVFYRRKYGEEFKQVMMEIVRGFDYSDDNQSLFLYVKDIDK